ncbi:MAG: glycogen/starch/alpha-glucan phosphorylase [Erysipelotrichaceae bacterium]|nr:glycogen/starch/alpha-glucan phosphorylase [Erysipelotrichaceae bacterium]
MAKRNDGSVVRTIFDSKENFKDAFRTFLEMEYGKSIEGSSVYEQYTVLGYMIMANTMHKWKETREKTRKKNGKILYYFSLEFLMGRLLSNNLMSLGVYDLVQEALKEYGIDINDLEECEADAGLGNGGLGRLAACFLDSLASLNYPGNGNTIRYRNGLFKQEIINNRQVEVPDQWLRYGYPWEIRKPSKAVTVKIGGDVDISRDEKGDLQFELKDYEEILAVPYDVPVIGSGTECTNTLRLWSAEPSDSLPSNMNYPQYLSDVENICLNLYPEDYSREGKLTRIKQEYFFVSAGLQTIIRDHLHNNPNLDNLADMVTIQLNDTHPSLAIPEPMRLLMDEHGYARADAYPIVTKVFAYTNHTIMGEALERWPVEYIKQIVPRVYLIIEEIDNQFINMLRGMGKSNNFIDSVRIIYDNNCRMANLSIIGSFSVNGVAEIHTNILKESTFRNFYKIFPEKFNNKTNGITQRRWLLYSNPELRSLIEDTIKIDLSKDFFKIEKLMDHVNDSDVQERFMEVKAAKKQQLSAYLKKLYDIDLDPESIFDVQAKRLHAYKRQLLNIMYIISLYHRIKNDPSFSMHKTTFIFGAKAASNYVFAKEVIKLINSVAEKVNNDPDVSKYINVFFIPNYRVSIAEKLMPAADVSEQISTAGKETSGTGNMKFMMNGAVTLGTMDGANVEIRQLVGDDNIVIFGLNEQEVNELRPSYKPYDYYRNDPVIKEVIDSLMDGTFDKDKKAFENICNEFLLGNDEYMILADFNSYREAHDKVYQLYEDRYTFAKMCLVNVAKSSYFSSDRTVSNYVKDIWHLEKIS